MVYLNIIFVALSSAAAAVCFFLDMPHWGVYNILAALFNAAIVARRIEE